MCLLVIDTVSAKLSSSFVNVLIVSYVRVLSTYEVMILHSALITILETFFSDDVPPIQDSASAYPAVKLRHETPQGSEVRVGDQVWIESKSRTGLVRWIGRESGHQTYYAGVILVR